MSKVRRCLEALIMAFTELRKVCGNYVPVKDNPLKSTCLENSDHVCNITCCPLLQPMHKV